jgi:phage gp36-like protein
MPYATVTDLQDRLGEARLIQLTDLTDPPLGIPDLAVAQKALDDAQAEIDGYLAGRYTLPLSPVPGVLRVHAITIAHYRLLGNAAGEIEREDYKSVRLYLERVADGRVALLPPAEVQPLVGAGAVLFNAGSKVMGREAAESGGT